MFDIIPENFIKFCIAIELNFAKSYLYVQNNSAAVWPTVFVYLFPEHKSWENIFEQKNRVVPSAHDLFACTLSR